VKQNSFLFAFISLFIFNPAMAAKVSVVKGNKIMMQGESTSVGDEHYVLNEQGKKVAIVRVIQAKGDRAVAQILKGSAKQGYTTQPKSGGGSMSTSAGGSGGHFSGGSGNSFGLMGGYLMNTMNVQATGLTSGMSGSGFGVLGYYDYALSSSFVGRVAAGYEIFGAKGANTASSPVNCTTNCDVNINYLSLYAYGRWNAIQGPYKLWLGGGIGYLYPMSTSSTVFPNSGQLQANQVYVAAVGMDIGLSNKNYIPVSLEYGLFPSSSTVTANIIFLRAGYAWNL